MLLFICGIKYKIPMKKSSGIVLAIDVYGYENRYLTVKEECRLWVYFEVLWNETGQSSECGCWSFTQ